jgi:hypothetical protein
MAATAEGTDVRNHAGTVSAAITIKSREKTSGPTVKITVSSGFEARHVVPEYASGKPAGVAYNSLNCS